MKTILFQIIWSVPFPIILATFGYHENVQQHNVTVGKKSLEKSYMAQRQNQEMQDKLDNDSSVTRQ